MRNVMLYIHDSYLLRCIGDQLLALIYNESSNIATAHDVFDISKHENIRTSEHQNIRTSQVTAELIGAKACRSL